MDENNLATLSDSEVLFCIEGLSDVVLQKYRRYLKNIGILKNRERLLESRDIPLLSEIVEMKKSNPGLFFNRIIEIVVERYVAKTNLIDKIFENSEGARISEKFLEICKAKGIEESEVDDFYTNLNKASDFVRACGGEDLSGSFNNFVDVLISAIVGRNI